MFMRGILRTWSVAATAVALAMTLSACGEEEKPVTLPSLTPSPTPTTTTGLTDEEQIRTIYTDYVAGWPDAQDLPKEERREFLTKWTIDPQQSGILEILSENDKQSLRYTGDSVPHVFRVKINRQTAVVDDCSDDRKATLKNTKTGKVERFGWNWYVVKLKRTNNGWRVLTTSMRNESCVEHLR